MKGVLAVTRREIVERRNVWVAAGVASLIPLAFPLVPGMQGEPAGEVQAITAFSLAGAFCAGLAIVLGASVVGRELADRRLGFYFSRPLSAVAIWAGKFFGALLLMFGSAFLVLLPATLLGRAALVQPEETLPILYLVAAASVLVLFVVHALGLWFRSRSLLFLLDWALAGATAVTVAATARALAREHATGALWRGLSAFAVIVFAGFVAGAFASVARGRTDIRAAHRALSVTLWGILLTGTLLFALYSRWILAANPRDLVAVEEVDAAPRGNWVKVSGTARGRGDYRPTFLLNTATGVSRKLKQPGGSWPLAFSRDGKHVVWLEGAGQPPFELHTLDLEGPAGKPIRTKLLFDSRWISLSLSPDGERIATLGRKGGETHPVVSVYEIASGRLIGSAPVAAGGQIFFATPDVVRVYSAVNQPRDVERDVVIAEFDLSAKKIETTGRIDAVSGPVILRGEPSGRRILVHESRKKQIRLHDGPTGSSIAVLSSGESITSRRAEFLSDGRIAVAEASGAGARLRILGAEGGEQTAISLGPGGSIALAGEAADGKIIVVVRPAGAATFDSKIFLVDVSTGEARKIADGLFPVSAHAWWFASDPTLSPAPGSEAVKLFFGPGYSLVRLDPFTGERRTVVPGGKRP
ncbi:MAG: WD40 repeat domain-containing protein [Acidobacteriota bacterium]